MLPSLAAHADTLQTFEISIAFEHGVGFGGQVVLDTITNLFTSFGGAAGGSPTGNGGFFSASQGVSNGDYFLNSATNGPYTLSILLPITSLVGYNGSAVCTESLGSGCFTSSYLDFPAISGSLTPIASTTVTPEPSSIALLGTGMLGVCGAQALCLGCTGRSCWCLTALGAVAKFGWPPEDGLNTSGAGDVRAQLASVRRRDHALGSAMVLPVRHQLSRSRADDGRTRRAR